MDATTKQVTVVGSCIAIAAAGIPAYAAWRHRAWLYPYMKVVTTVGLFLGGIGLIVAVTK